MTKIFCKDSRDMCELQNESIDLVITSPPYFDLKNYNRTNNHKDQLGSLNSYDEYISNLNIVWKECIRVLVPDGKMCINCIPIFLSNSETKYKRRVTKLVITDIENFMYSTNQMFLHALFIWDKRKIVRFSSFGSYPYPPNIFSTFPFEWIIVFSKKGKRLPINRIIKEKSKLTTKEWQEWAVNSIWDFSPAKASVIGHPAPFPEELPKRLIKLYSFVGDTILDPFCGSGTTLFVAKQLERKSIGYEINPDYVKIAKQRTSQLHLNNFQE